MRRMKMSEMEYYVPSEGRKVNLWSLLPAPEEFFEDLQGAALKLVKACLEAGLEARRDALIASLKRGPVAAEAGPEAKAQAADPKDFVEEKGGVY